MAQAVLKRSALIALAAFAAVVMTAAVNAAYAFQVAVAPMRHEFVLGNKPVTRSLKLINQSPEDMKVVLRVANFDLDNNNNVREIAPTKQSLDQWIIIRPLKFKIKAGQTRTVRFAVRPFSRPKTGEHRAIIFIERADKPKKKKGTISIGFRFGVVVYAHVGQTIRRANLKDVQVAPDGMVFDIVSTGNAHARMLGTFGVWRANKFPGKTVAAAMISRSEFTGKTEYIPKGAAHAAVLPDIPVLPGTRRKVRARFAKTLPPGSYRALVRGMVGSQSINQLLSFKVGG